MKLKKLNPGKAEEIFLTLRFSEKTWPEVLSAAVKEAAGPDAALISQEIFGIKKNIGILEEIFKKVEWPVTWIEEGAGDPECAGTQIHAIKGCEVKRLKDERGMVVASMYEDEYSVCCRAGNIMPRDLSGSRASQAAEVFEKINMVLRKADMKYSHLMRTWFFIEDILSWYDKFNHVRDSYCKDHKILTHRLPASTGVGARNSEAAALAGSFTALKRKHAGISLETALSPMQDPPSNYGSSFSRAIKIGTPECRKLYVSGTASIDKCGETVCVDDIRGQINFTMEVVSNILQNSNMGWNDVNRGIGYFKSPDYIPVFLKNWGNINLPLILVKSDICRDNLLFEIELDSIIKL